VDGKTGIVDTVAGNGQEGYSGDGVLATAASLHFPSGVAVGKDGTVFIADTTNSRIRKVDSSTGIISTIAGDGFFGFSGDGGNAQSARINGPRGLTLDDEGNLFIVDGGRRIRKVDAQTGKISTVAGNGIWGISGDGGPATEARMISPTDVAVDSEGNLFIADPWSQRIRAVRQPD